MSDSDLFNGVETIWQQPGRLWDLSLTSCRRRDDALPHVWPPIRADTGWMVENQLHFPAVEDVLPFGRLWYGELDATSSAID